MLALTATLMLSWISQQLPRDVGLIEIHADQIVARLAVKPYQLEAYCHAGIDEDVLAIPSDIVRATTGWSVDATVQVFVGPRRVGSARVADLAMGRGCWIEAALAMDGPLPWTMPGDVIWATVRNRPSSPPVPVARGLIHAAERAAAADLESALSNPDTRRDCLATLHTTSGGFRRGALVGVSCDTEAGAFGRIYVVRSDRSAVELRIPGVARSDSVSLLEVITPAAEKNLDLVISAETDQGQERRWVRVAVPEPPRKAPAARRAGSRPEA